MIDTTKPTESEKVVQKEEEVTASTAGDVTQPIKETDINLKDDDVQAIGKTHGPQNNTPQVASIVKSKGFDDQIAAAQGELAKCPDALDFGATNSDRVGKYFAFANNSNEAVEVRSSVQKILRKLYEDGAYSPGDFSSRLNVEANAVWALIDPSFRSDNNLAVHEDNLLEVKEPQDKNKKSKEAKKSQDKNQ